MNEVQYVRKNVEDKIHPRTEKTQKKDILQKIKIPNTTADDINVSALAKTQGMDTVICVSQTEEGIEIMGV